MRQRQIPSCEMGRLFRKVSCALPKSCTEAMFCAKKCQQHARFGSGVGSIQSNTRKSHVGHQNDPRVQKGAQLHSHAKFVHDGTSCDALPCLQEVENMCVQNIALAARFSTRALRNAIQAVRITLTTCASTEFCSDLISLHCCLCKRLKLRRKPWHKEGRYAVVILFLQAACAAVA